MREIIKWTLALVLGAFGALLSLAVALFSLVAQLVMGLLMIMGLVAVGAKGVIDDMDQKSGNVFLKTNSREDHRKIIEMLYADFKAEFTRDSIRYQEVGPYSRYDQLRETYRMLPQETKNDIREIWGKDEMLVSTANLKNIFGVRKL